MVVMPIFAAAVAGAVDDDKKGQRTEERAEQLDDAVITSAETAEQPMMDRDNEECSPICGEATDGGRKTPTPGEETVTNNGGCTLSFSSSERMVSELIAAVIEQNRQRQQLQKQQQQQQQLMIDTSSGVGGENGLEGEQKRVELAPAESGDSWQQCKVESGTITANGIMPNIPTTTATNAMGGDESQQQQKEMFLRWVQQHGNNMYPSREQKERLAAQMGTSYEKVNKLFANYRRRQHKHQKVVQKSSLTSSAVPMELPQRTNADGEGQTKSSGSNLEDERRTTNSWEDERERKIDETIEDIWNKVIGGGVATTSAAGTDRHWGKDSAASVAGSTAPAAATHHHAPQKQRLSAGRASPLHATGHKRKALSAEGEWAAADDHSVPSSSAFFYLAAPSRELTPPPSQPSLGGLSFPQANNGTSTGPLLLNGFVPAATTGHSAAVPLAHHLHSVGGLSHQPTATASAAELLQRQCQQMLLARQAAVVLQQQQQQQKSLLPCANANANASSPSVAVSAPMPTTTTMAQQPTVAAPSAAAAASMLIANLIQQQQKSNGGIGNEHQANADDASAGVNPLLLVAQQIQLLQQRQQYAMMEQAIKKEIYELLASVATSGTNSAATNNNNGGAGCATPAAAAAAAVDVGTGTPPAQSVSVVAPSSPEMLTALQRAQMIGMLNLLRQREQQQQMPTHGQTVVHQQQHQTYFAQDQQRLQQQQQQQFLSPPLTLSPSNSVHNDHHQLGGLSSVSPSTVVVTPPPQGGEQYQQHHQQHFFMGAAVPTTMTTTTAAVAPQMDFELIEKQIVAQHNELSAKEAEAVAVLAGLADGCR